MHEPVVQRELGENLILLRLFAFLALIFGASPSIAGEMTFLKDLNMPPDSHPGPEIGCSHRFSGSIEKGDLAKFNIIRPGQTITVLCLDSPGGSFAEAVKIGEFMKEQNIGTLLERDAKCLSACSLIFMSGSYYAHEVGSLFWRIMHPKAQLGFHVPSLIVEEGNYQKESVEKAYQIAMKSISEMIFKLVRKSGYIGGDTMKTGLVGHMISTPFDQMYMIDTVDKVGRWDIRLEPAPARGRLTDRQYYHACENLQKWSQDESAANILPTSNAEEWTNRENKQNKLTVTVTTDDFSGEHCKFEYNQGYLRVTGYSDAGADFGSIQIHGGVFGPASLLLSELDISPIKESTRQSADSRNYLAANKFCTVIRNNRVVETHPCQQKPVIEKGIQFLVYTWQSGAKTVLETRADGQMSVNGSPFSPRENLQGHECYLNQNSGNHFCSRL